MGLIKYVNVTCYKMLTYWIRWGKEIKIKLKTEKNPFVPMERSIGSKNIQFQPLRCST